MHRFCCITVCSDCIKVKMDPKFVAKFSLISSKVAFNDTIWCSAVAIIGTHWQSNPCSFNVPLLTGMMALYGDDCMEAVIIDFSSCTDPIGFLHGHTSLQFYFDQFYSISLFKSIKLSFPLPRNILHFLSKTELIFRQKFFYRSSWSDGIFDVALCSIA